MKRAIPKNIGLAKALNGYLSLKTDAMKVWENKMRGI